MKMSLQVHNDWKTININKKKIRSVVNSLTANGEVIIEDEDKVMTEEHEVVIKLVESNWSDEQSTTDKSLKDILSIINISKSKSLLNITRDQNAFFLYMLIHYYLSYHVLIVIVLNHLGVKQTEKVN